MISNAARYLAIDGGGTKTAFLLADEKGNPIKQLTLGASNPNDVGMKQAKDILNEGIRSVCEGYSPEDIVLYAGIAGARTGNNKELFMDFLHEFGFKRYNCGSDIDSVIAMGDHPQQIVMILGTGVIAFAKNGDEVYRVAGWGQLFDGAGSGYDFGRDAICAALRAFDGTGPRTILTDLFLRELGEQAADHLAKFYAGGKRYIAGFCRLVFEAREKGDPVAEEIFHKNIQHVAGILRAAATKLDRPVAEVLFTGGLINAQQRTIIPALEKELGSAFHLVCARQMPIDGALRLAQKEAESC